MDRQDDENPTDARRFAALFPLANSEDAEADPGDDHGTITPRTAHLLYVGLASDLDCAALDLSENGDRPVSEDREWNYFYRLPRITWPMGHAWRKRFAGAISDLARDLDNGKWPLPHCHAEEMALHLGIDSAALAMDPMRGGAFHGHDELPESRDDYDFDLLREILFQDADIEFLFDPETEAFANPTHPMNQHLGIGDMRPRAWFENFNNMEPRAKQ